MKAVKIKENIYWVGGIDWNLRNFHGYLTQRGSTYNAYLIIDEKITLIDTVKHYLIDEMLERISDIIDPSKIDYVISNHVEMDHSGGLAKIMEIAPNATLITSPNGEKGLSKHFNTENWKKIVVKTGDVINLGTRNLNFVLTPMVHWPDNMVCYMPEEKILFSNDSFGQHLATSERFDDEYSLEIILAEAQKYYANIVMGYNTQVKKELEAIKDLEIDIIAPSHGIIFRKYVNTILEKYKKWANNIPDKKVLIVYDTMWDSTEKMAFAILEAFEEEGYFPILRNLQVNHISDIITEVLDAEYLCVGSPTLNKSILPTVAGFLSYLKGLSPTDRKAFAFGSYGWSGESVKVVADQLKDAKFEVLEEFRIQYIPSKEDLDNTKNRIKEIIARYND